MAPDVDSRLACHTDYTLLNLLWRLALQLMYLKCNEGSNRANKNLMIPNFEAHLYSVASLLPSPPPTSLYELVSGQTS